jgi:hypothetical protein
MLLWIRLRIAIAISEIVVGTAAQLALGALIGRATLDIGDAAAPTPLRAALRRPGSVSGR